MAIVPAVDRQGAEGRSLRGRTRACGGSRWVRAAVRALLCGAALAAAGRPMQPAEAQGGPPSRADVTRSAGAFRRIAVLPVKAVIGRPADLFAPERPPAHLEAAHRWERQLEHILRGPGGLVVWSPTQVRERLEQDHAATAASRMAQERYRLGLEYHHGLAPVRAIDSFRRAVQTYLDIGQDVIAVRPVADAQLMLGVAMLDAGDLVGAHVALRAAFALAPARQFRPRFFGPQVEAALLAALTDHAASGDHMHPYGDSARLARLARVLDVDGLVTTTLVEGSGGLEVHVAAFSRANAAFEVEVRLPLVGAAEVANARLSRWLACLPGKGAAPGAPPRPAHELQIDAAAAYALYLRQPTRRSFHSVGFSAGVVSSIRPGFGWYGRVTMDTSLSDPYRDLLYPFNSVRVVAGLEFAVRWSRVQFALQPGVDARWMGSFIATTDPDCKLFGESHRLCDRSSVADLASDVLFGPHAGLALRFDLGKGFVARAATSISLYVLPFDGSASLNFPLSAEFGLGARF